MIKNSIMALSSDRSIQLKHTNEQQTASSLSPNRVAPEDTEQMFQLIDSILPFEACLYHQVLPLSLRGTNLILGMVNPEDSTALDYVRRILAYMNCSLVPQPIAADRHQAALSAYLHHTGQLKQAAAQKLGLASGEGDRASGHSDNRHDRATLIVDRPENLNELEESDRTPEPETAEVPVAKAAAKPPQHAPAPLPSQGKLERQHTPSSAYPPTAPSTGLNLPVLEVQAYHLSSPVDALATLPPQQLLNELLGRILLGGIGRLYFERHPDRGRILWSQNGVLQSVLEGIDTAVFQGVINELKRLTHMSMIQVEKPKQVEIERIYQQNRLMLRLRVMPGSHGEEATLQVLRGAALKFYQQQQLEHISRDALTIAQQLQHKVNEMRDRTQRNPALATSQLETLPALDQLIKNVEQQLAALKQLAASQKNQDHTTS